MRLIRRGNPRLRRRNQELLCRYRAPTNDTTAPAGANRINGGDGQARGKHLPTGPDAGIEIKYCFKHTQRRDPKDHPMPIASPRKVMSDTAIASANRCTVDS